MSGATLLESRVNKLEQDNQRLKLTIGALFLVLAAVPLIGAVIPEQIPELIRAQGFEVSEEDGTLRAGMNDLGIFYFDGSSLNYGISYYDENLKLVWSTSCAPNC